MVSIFSVLGNKTFNKIFPSSNIFQPLEMAQVIANDAAHCLSAEKGGFNDLSMKIIFLL